MCAGGIHVAMTMGTAATNSFMMGFNHAGIPVDQGHETMISACWLAECYWSEETSLCNRNIDGSGLIGILVNGQDNIVSDVIIFDLLARRMVKWSQISYLGFIVGTAAALRLLSMVRTTFRIES